MNFTVYSASALSQMGDYQMRDSFDFFSPDIVAVPEPHHELLINRTLSVDIPVVVTAGMPRETLPVYSAGSVDLVHVTHQDDLEKLPKLERDGDIDTGNETYLLSDLLSVEVDLTKLEARLEGGDGYKSALPVDDLEGSYTHLTAAANPGYWNEWGNLTVKGVMPGENERLGQGQSEIASHQLFPDGVISTRTISPDKFGLRGVNQIGQSRAETLRKNGITTRKELTDAEIYEVKELPGFGRSLAETVIDSAVATVDGEVRRHGDEGFPSTEPVFIDIETDGLNPTMVWLIGALDRQGEETYMSFLARDPEQRGKAVEAFMSWLTANPSNRPVVAYNGMGFDFPILEEHIEQYCPDYMEDWQDTWTFDPLFWARGEGQATLPGRTNELEDVATALGWEGDDTGLSGAAVGQLFQRWMANPCGETELDWERHEEYCEDDVRALAHVYDAIDDASRNPGGEDLEATESTTTSQGTLGDF